PNNETAECTGNGQATVNYPPASATDICDGPLPTTCVPPSGSSFPVGTTTVQCTATDAAGHSSSCSFTVTVADTTPPSISCPNNETAECTGNGQATVNYPPASATDICDGPLPTTCVPPSGSSFPVGTTTVTCTATDAAGHSSSCSFTVTVADTTPPSISCPNN